MTSPFTYAGPDRAAGDRTAIHRPGTAVTRVPDAVASAPFWAEWLLHSDRDGDTTVVRATMDPGVTTHWHSHPCGQVLYALSGVGAVQQEGGPVEELRAGDCAWLPPGTAHWHGAAASSPFSYISVQAVRDGTAVHWLGPVAAGRERS